MIIQHLNKIAFKQAPEMLLKRSSADISTMKFRDNYVYTKLLAASVIGITTGAFIGMFITKVLGKNGLDLFTYIPDDDNDDEKKEEVIDESKSRIDTNTYFFGDYRINLSFVWNQVDSDLASLMKTRLNQELEDLQNAVEQKGELNAYDKKEVITTKEYLASLMKINHEREQAIKKQGKS